PQGVLEHPGELSFRRRELGRALLDLPPKLELRLFRDRDVRSYADEADDFPVRPKPGTRNGAEPAILAVVPKVARFEREGLQRRLAGDAFRDDAVDVVGMDPRTPVEQPRFFRVEARPERELAITVVDEVPHAVDPGHPH